MIVGVGVLVVALGTCNAINRLKSGVDQPGEREKLSEGQKAVV